MVAARGWLKENSTHFDKAQQSFNKECELIDSIPFTPQNRFYASLIEHRDGNREVYINGAPEHLLDWSTLSEPEAKKIKAKIHILTREGKRVIGMAKKDVPETFQKISESDVMENLEWVGMLVFTDPVRVGVKEAFKQTYNAGIKTILITGDYANTALCVMDELEMEVDKDRVIVGSELEKISENEVADKLRHFYKEGKGAILFARTKPEQKLKVINALKKNGEVVAMMGDGVNDAPALHRADIGIVVGDATDVAKESADLVLMDSSFETIVATVREGRGIFNNIRKIILYLLSDSFEEIIAVVGTIVFKLPLPVTAAQILWINIVSDGFPHLSLTVDPEEKGIMSHPPRSPQTGLVETWMKIFILIISTSGGILALLIFAYYLGTTGNIEVARSVAFATLGINSLVYVFSIRTLKEPFWRENPFKNKWLNLAIVAGLVFQVGPFLFGQTRAFLGLTILEPVHWLVVFLVSGLMFIIIELAKTKLTD